MHFQLTSRRLITAVFIAGMAPIATCADFAANGTTTLSVNVSAEAAIKITTGTTDLTKAGTLFEDYLGTTNFTYKVRTGQSSGSGNILLQITRNFGTGGPDVAADALKYSCTAGASATPCSAGQTASTGTTTPVAAFGADAHSSKAGDTGSVTWTLTNDPAYKVGIYTAEATFTISAT